MDQVRIWDFIQKKKKIMKAFKQVHDTQFNLFKWPFQMCKLNISKTAYNFLKRITLAMERMGWRGVEEKKQGDQLNYYNSQARGSDILVLNTVVGIEWSKWRQMEIFWW